LDAEPPDVDQVRDTRQVLGTGLRLYSQTLTFNKFQSLSFSLGKKKRLFRKGPPAMFCLLALHKPPTTISYTGWHEGYTGTLKMTTPRDAAAAGGAAARAADGKKESEMPNAMSACLSPWKASHLATSSCPVNYNNSSYNYTHRIE